MTRRRILHLLRRAGELVPLQVLDGDTVAVIDDVLPERLLRLVAEHETVVVWPGERPRPGGVHSQDGEP